MRVIDLVVQRAEQVDREPAVILDSSKVTYRDLLALVERASKLISSSVRLMVACSWALTRSTRLSASLHR